MCVMRVTWNEGVVALGESPETAVAEGADQARSGFAATTECISFARSAKGLPLASRRLV